MGAYCEVIVNLRNYCVNDISILETPWFGLSKYTKEDEPYTFFFDKTFGDYYINHYFS